MAVKLLWSPELMTPCSLVGGYKYAFWRNLLSPNSVLKFVFYPADMAVGSSRTLVKPYRRLHGNVTLSRLSGAQYSQKIQRVA
jgi:hypothetical protein